MKKQYIAPEQTAVVLLATNTLLTGSIDVYKEEVDEETTREKYGEWEESEGTAW